MYATGYGAGNLVKKLLEAGATLSIQDKQGRTAKDLGNLYSRIKLVELIVQHEKISRYR